METEHMSQEAPPGDFEDIKVLAGEYGTEIGGGVSLLFLSGLIVMGGIMSYGVVLGTLTLIPVGIILYKMREACPRLYNWILTHQFLTVVLMTIGFTGLFGTTATGLIAGAVFGTLKVIMLQFFEKYFGLVKVPENAPTILESLQKVVHDVLPKRKDQMIKTVVPVQSETVTEKPPEKEVYYDSVPM